VARFLVIAVDTVLSMRLRLGSAPILLLHQYNGVGRVRKTHTLMPMSKYTAGIISHSMVDPQNNLVIPYKMLHSSSASVMGHVSKAFVYISWFTRRLFRN
jgi:hypothetical protein